MILGLISWIFSQGKSHAVQCAWRKIFDNYVAAAQQSFKHFLSFLVLGVQG